MKEETKDKITKLKDKFSDIGEIIFDILIFVIIIYGIFYGVNHKKNDVKNSVESTRGELLNSYSIDCFEYEYSGGKVSYGTCQPIEVYSGGISINGEYYQRGILSGGFDNVDLMVALMDLKYNGATPFLEQKIEDDYYDITVAGLTGITVDLNKISTEMYNEDLLSLNNDQYLGIETLLSQYYHSLDPFKIYKNSQGEVVVENVSCGEQYKTDYSNIPVTKIHPTFLNFKEIISETFNKDLLDFNPTQEELNKLTDVVNNKLGYKEAGFDRFEMGLNGSGELIITDIIVRDYL